MHASHNTWQIVTGSSKFASKLQDSMEITRVCTDAFRPCLVNGVDSWRIEISQRCSLVRWSCVQEEQGQVCRTSGQFRTKLKLPWGQHCDLGLSHCKPSLHVMFAGAAESGKEWAGHGKSAADGSEEGHKLIRNRWCCFAINNPASHAATKVVTEAMRSMYLEFPNRWGNVEVCA